MARYKQLLFYAAKLPVMTAEQHKPENKVEGCVSQVGAEGVGAGGGGGVRPRCVWGECSPMWCEGIRGGASARVGAAGVGCWVWSRVLVQVAGEAGVGWMSTELC
jgi:hypothetical protein